MYYYAISLYAIRRDADHYCGTRIHFSRKSLCNYNFVPVTEKQDT